MRVQVRGADCALFPAAAELPFHQNALVALPLKRFTPTVQQVATAEQKLATLFPSAYAANTYCAEPLKQSAPAYKRQYYGFYNAKNQPCFYIRFFFSTPADYSTNMATWLQKPVKASAKPGSDAWDMSYNLSAGEFYDFMHCPLD
jgi:hypothetical protein